MGARWFGLSLTVKAADLNPEVRATEKKGTVRGAPLEKAVKAADLKSEVLATGLVGGAWYSPPFFLGSAVTVEAADLKKRGSRYGSSNCEETGDGHRVVLWCLRTAPSRSRLGSGCLPGLCGAVRL